MRNLTGVSWKVGQIKRFLKKKPYMTLQDAATRLGCSREYVRQLKSRFNLPFQQRPRPKCWVCGKDVYRKGAVHLDKCKLTPIAQSKRFWVQVDIRANSACWEWQGCKHPLLGYGRFMTSSAPGVHRGDYAHRVAWELTYGSIPEGMQVLHHCDNPPCCNPIHLFLGTVADNMHDRDRKGRNKGRHGRNLKSHCVHGHEYAEENSYYVPKTGQRQCKKCTRIRNRDWERRHRALRRKEQT